MYSDHYDMKHVINFDEKKLQQEPTNKPDLVLDIPEPEIPKVIPKPQCSNCHKKGFTLVVPTDAPKPTRATFIAKTIGPTTKTTVKDAAKNTQSSSMKLPEVYDESNRCVGSCPPANIFTMNFIFIPHQNCNKYCFCSEGKPLPFSCSPNLHFDYRNQMCDDPRKVRCARRYW